MNHAFVWALILITLLVGCAPAQTGTAVQTPALEEQEYEIRPAPSTVPANLSPEDFSMRFFNDIADDDEKNPVVSPLSAYLALAMAANGAKGDTLSQFEAVMGGSLADINALAEKALSECGESSGSTKLNIANSLWIDDAFNISSDYKKNVSNAYKAEIFNMLLSSDKAREAVNAWVKEKTQGLIPSLRDENYPEGTLLSIINTVYFKALWRDSFEGYLTMDDIFTTTGGERQSVPFLHDYGCHREYFSTEAGDGVVLPYDDGDYVFVALRPNSKETVRELSKRLSAAMLNDCITSAEDTYMDLAMPKFSLEWGFDMGDTLRSLGLCDAFDPERADLSGIGSANNMNLYISSVQQKVKITVDEKGTEAAAVTEVAMAGAAFMPEKPLEVKLDSPFVYAVVSANGGMPLFIGILDSPVQ